MNYKRIGRMAICLLMVFALLVNVSPIRAEASATAVLGTAVTVVAWDVLAATLVGCGVMAAADSTDFDYVVDTAVDYYKQQGVIDTNGYMDVYSLGASGMLGLPLDFIQGLFDNLWELGVLADGSHNGRTLTIGGETGIATCDYPFYALVWKCGNLGYYMLASTHYGAKVYFNDNTYTLANGQTWNPNGTDYYNGYYIDGYSGESILPENYSGFTSLGDITAEFNATGKASGYVFSYVCQTYLVSVAGSPSSPLDVALGDVAPQGSTIEDGYPEWTANAVNIAASGEAENLTVPIGMPSVGGSSPSYTQEDVHTGTVPFIIVVDETGTGGGETEPTEPDTGEGTFVPMDPNYSSLVERLFGNISSKIEEVKISIEEIPTKFREFFQDLRQGIDELPAKFAEWFNDIRTKLQQLVSGQITLADLLAGLFKPIRDAIVDALQYLFAPSETFISGQVNSLIAKYPSSENLFTLGEQLKEFFLSLGQTPPVIYINLGDSAGSYYLGGTVAFLDLTWYAQYKGTMDAILGGFLWLWFAWRMWLKLPGILEGMSGEAGKLITRRESSNDN